MPEWLFDRWQIIKGILARPWLQKLAIVWAIISAYDLLGAQIFPEDIAQKLPRVREVVGMTTGWLPWWAWAWIGTALLTAATVEYAVRLHRVTRPNRKADGTNYWTLCEAVTWIAFGKAMDSENYSLSGIDILPPEEIPAIRMAGDELLISLQDEERIISYGRKSGIGDHTAVPFTFFLSSRAGLNIFNDSFQLSARSAIEDILDSEITQWKEVKIPGAQVLRLWPKGRVYVRPKGANPAAAAKAIEEFMREADTLSAKRLESSNEVDSLQDEYDTWRQGVVDWFRANSTEDRARYFASGRILTINRHVNAVNEDHCLLISKIVHDREALQNLLILETAT